MCDMGSVERRAGLERYLYLIFILPYSCLVLSKSLRNLILEWPPIVSVSQLVQSSLSEKNLFMSKTTRVKAIGITKKDKGPERGPKASQYLAGSIALFNYNVFV